MRVNKRNKLPLVIAVIFVVCACMLCACDGNLPIGDASPFVYEHTETGYTVTGVKDTGAKSIIVPEEYRGEAVTAIADGAFAGCSSATKVVIPNSVTNIGKGALRGCRSLGSITIPFTGYSAKALDDKSTFGYIFGQSDYAGSAEVVQSFGELPEDRETFYIPLSLTEVVFMGEKIPYGAFSGCNMISTFVVGPYVTDIAENAFTGNNLAYVYCESNATAAKMVGVNACGGLLQNVPAVAINKQMNRLSGYIEGYDTKSEWTRDGVAYDLYSNVKAYRFEAEAAELAGGLVPQSSDYGANGVPTSGGSYVTGFYPAGGAGGCEMEFRINASKAATVRFTYCCAARSTHYFNSCYRLTLNDEVVVAENNVNLSLPQGETFKFTQWTRFYIMELELKEGENVFNMHFTPDGNETATAFSNDMNVDYIEFETDAILTWAK